MSYDGNKLSKNGKMQCIYGIGTMPSSHLGMRKKLKIFYGLYSPEKDK